MNEPDASPIGVEAWLGTADLSAYSDVVNLRSSPYGVTISFGVTPIGVTPAREVARIQVSWQQVSTLRRLLERIERRYRASGMSPDIAEPLLKMLRLTDEDLKRADSEPLFTFPDGQGT